MKKVILSIAAFLVVFLAGCGMRTPANNPDMSSFIGEDRAKEIALQKAGITAEGVIFDRVELDRDSGRWSYDVEFRQGRVEYDAEISADDGAIISFEMDAD